MKFFVADNFSFGSGQADEPGPFSAQPFNIGVGVEFRAGVGQDIFGTSSGNSQQRWQSQADSEAPTGPGFSGINPPPSSKINYEAYDQRQSAPIISQPRQKMRDLTATQRFRILTGLIDAGSKSSDRNAVTPNTTSEVKANSDMGPFPSRPALASNAVRPNPNQVGNFGTRVQDNIVSRFGTASVGARGESSALHLSSIINNPARIGAPEGRPWASPIG